jgi:hypothetical protein
MNRFSEKIANNNPMERIQDSVADSKNTIIGKCGILVSVINFDIGT